MAATFRDADTSHAVQEAPQSPPGLHGAQLGCPPPPPPPPPHGNGEAAPSAACDASEDAEPPPLADTSSSSEDDEPCARRAAVVQQAMPGQEAAAAAVQPLAGARATVRNGGASISRVTAVLHCLDAAAAAAVAAGLDPWFALGVQLQVQDGAQHVPARLVLGLRGGVDMYEDNPTRPTLFAAMDGPSCFPSPLRSRM